MMSVIYGNPITLGGGGVKGKKLSELTEGSLISVLEDGKLVPFYVAKHNYEADLNGEGRTLLVRKNLHSKQVWNASNVNTYAGSSIDAWLNDDYTDLLSSTVKAQMGVTTFKYTVGNGNVSVLSLQRSVFLPSMTELGLTVSYASTEGSALPIASSLQIGYLDGTAVAQWTRSPHIQTTNNACILGAGGSGGANYCTSAYGIRPCFTLPANMALNTEPYADGSWGLADEEVLFDTTTAKTTPLAPVNYTNGIADLTPAQLHEIAAAISANPNINKYSSVVYYDKGDMHRKISVGDAASVDVGTVANTMKILGFNHDVLTVGAAYGKPTVTGKAGISFHAVITSATGFPMNISNTTAGGWEDTIMRKTHLISVLSQLPNELRNVIKTINKVTNIGNGNTGLETVSDNCTLPSEVEVFGRCTYSAAGEGEQYAYYRAGNSKLLYNTSGATIDWWLRSSSVTSGTFFCAVNKNADATQYAASTAIAAAFIYCI